MHFTLIKLVSGGFYTIALSRQIQGCQLFVCLFVYLFSPYFPMDQQQHFVQNGKSGILTAQMANTTSFYHSHVTPSVLQVLHDAFSDCREQFHLCTLEGREFCCPAVLSSLVTANTWCAWIVSGIHTWEHGICVWLSCGVKFLGLPTAQVVILFSLALEKTTWS